MEDGWLSNGVAAVNRHLDASQSQQRRKGLKGRKGQTVVGAGCRLQFDQEPRFHTSKLQFSTCSCSCSCSGTAIPSTLAAGSETRTWFAADAWSALHEQKQEQKRKQF
jgi:hypothetical protein